MSSGPRRTANRLLAVGCLLAAATTTGGGLTAAADPLDESGVVHALADIDKLAKLQEEGLGDMDEFMGSFAVGQQATDEVKCGATPLPPSPPLCHLLARRVMIRQRCASLRQQQRQTSCGCRPRHSRAAVTSLLTDLCRHLLIDLHTAVSKLRQPAEPGADEDLRDVGIAQRTEQHVLTLCEQQTPRFLGLYKIHDCTTDADRNHKLCAPELLHPAGRASPLRFTLGKEDMDPEAFNARMKATDEGIFSQYLCIFNRNPGANVSYSPFA